MELGTTKFPLIGRQICLTKHKSIKAEQNVISLCPTNIPANYAKCVFPQIGYQEHTNCIISFKNGLNMSRRSNLSNKTFISFKNP